MSAQIPPIGDVTLALVASAAGVSISTASRVLNQSSSRVPISERTATRVRSAADRLGYVPHAAARMLRTGKARMLGVLGANPAFFTSRGGFVGEIMHGLMHAGVEAGYHICLLTGWEHVTEGNPLHADLGSADGLLVLNRDLYRHAAHAEALRRFRLPIVYALEYPDDAEAWWTAPDDVQGGQLAATQLIAVGHRRIAFVKSSIYPGIFGRRQRGWAEAMHGNGLDAGPIIDIDDASAAKQLTTSTATAFVCANESIGQWCRSALTAAGLQRDLVMFSFFRAGEQAGEPQPHPHVGHTLSQTISAAVAQLIARVEGRTTARQVKTAYAFQGTLEGP